jgi:transposase
LSMPYSEGFKARMIERMAGPEGISANALAKDVGVCQSTLSHWLRLRSNRRVEPMDEKKGGSKARTAQEKLRIVHEASHLDDGELGAFLRREGLHEAQLREWIEAVSTALSTSTPKRGNRKSPKETKRIRELEKDLRRKEKALAEVTALLALKKKLETLWGDEDDATSTRNET